MRKIFKTFCLILLLISPLYPALLTEDLEVISPTGLAPIAHEYCFLKAEGEGSNCTVSIQFMDTPRGVCLIRRNTKTGAVQVAQPKLNTNQRIVVIKSSSGDKAGEGNMQIKVILE